MKAKTFDCVKAKHEIQQRTLAETAGLSQEQRRREAEQVILTDPILGPVWRAARQITIDVRPSTGT